MKRVMPDAAQAEIAVGVALGRDQPVGQGRAVSAAGATRGVAGVMGIHHNDEVAYQELM